MGKILVIGSTCVDVIIKLERLPVTADDIHPYGQKLQLGGCAYNVAAICRSLGGDVVLLCPVGTGLYGEFVKKELPKKGFPVLLTTEEEDNACCYCLVEDGGERTFLSLHGAEYVFRKEWLDPYLKEDYSFVYICGNEIEEPAGKAIVDFTAEYHALHPDTTIFYAPGPCGSRVPDGRNEFLYGLHPILHINEKEARELGLGGSVEASVGNLMAQTGKPVIVTLGEEGAACFYPEGECIRVPAVPTRVVDTIGAGDSHIGALMACLSKGMSMEESLKEANAMASRIVAVEGAAL